MNQKQQAKIKTIENLIQEINSTLALWKQEIEKYTLTLQQLTNQLSTIKKQITK